MPTFQTQIISLVCNTTSKDNVLDQATSAEPEAWWAADLTIRASLFSDDGVTILDVSDLQSATLSLKDPSNLDGSPLYQATIGSFDNTTTAASWNAGTNQHCLFTIPADDLSFGGLTNGQRLLRLSVSAITTGGKTGVLCVGTLNLIDAGDESPDSNPVNAITVSQAQAMVAALAWTQAVLNLAAAGTTDIKSTQSWLLARAPASLAAGSGTYVVNLTLDPANALAGAVIRIPIDFPASLNPTVNIYGGTTGGTLLQTITQPDATQARSYLFVGGFDGTDWHKEFGAWLD